MRIVTIKDRARLIQLYRIRNGFKTEYFFFRAQSNELPYSRFCFSTKGALANSVLRNKVKRWQKAALQQMPDLPQGLDILITTLKNPSTLNFVLIQNELLLFFNHVQK